MHILSGAEAKDIREMFIGQFVDTACNYFQNRIENMMQFSDGLRYTGYLWDCLFKRERVSYNYIMNQLEGCINPIYIFWDIHSCDRVRIKNYWKYPIDSVLCISPAEIQAVMQTLPEDCYFFDDSLSWAFALTHEELKPGKRLCYMVSNL